MGEETKVLEGINQAIGTMSTNLEAKLNEFGKMLPAKVDSTAELAKGPMEGITNLKVWDIPVGEALIGGFTAVIGSELIDGFLAAQPSMVKGIVKLAGAGVAIKWGGRLLGSAGSKALAIILAYDGLRQIVPIDEYASKLVGAIKPLTGGGLGGKAGMRETRVVRQAEAVAGNYYARLGG